ncbi:MAG: M3 family metallopeptidase [Steroidobacteraceae bacterium]|jgi:oligopeptidase A|nr:M3 family metallopeptidase [Steroidobacteraceae bacterium]
MQNPLLATEGLPDYSRIRAEHVEPAVRTQLDANRAALARLLEQPTPTFASLVEPFEALQHRLNRVFAPVAHLNAVLNSDELRAAYNACLPLLAEYQTEVGQNEALAAAYERIRDAEASTLTAAQRKVLDFALREFRLAGVRLPVERKARFKELMQELAKLQSKFEEQVLDATHAWSKHVTDESLLAGLPGHVRSRGANAARERGLAGWWLALDQPTYLAVLTHGESVELRREFYDAWTTRASDRGPFAGRHDNGPIIESILRLRHEAAAVLGFGSFAELSLATKMADSVPAVVKFLEELADHYVPAAHREYAELEAWAGRKLDAWDVPYYAEKLQHERHSVSEEALRPWFPLPRVLAGLFEVARRLYGVRFEPREDVALWHADARYFRVADAEGRPIGGFYLDPYARDKKRGGAWMSEVTVRKRLAGDGQELPVANLVCNFAPPPAPGRPALLTHTEVLTLFHEFGHALHHLLTRVDYPSLAGINGVPWDAVELPSQIMENWAWRPEVLPLISAHVDTGEPLPQAELDRLLATRTFHAGLAAVRQLEFALFDFRLHAEYDPARGARVNELLDEVRGRVAVVKPPEWSRFAYSFQHIFAGGYAAGYYSYKWAEVLAADAFAAFAEAGIFDAGTAQRFLENVLSQGGNADQMAAFVAFRGRKPEVGPLLAQDGVSPPERAA